VNQHSIRKLGNAVSNPRLYVAWALLVVVALVVTYFGDPYIFAFATFALAAVSAVIGLMGLAAALVRRSQSSGPSRGLERWTSSFPRDPTSSAFPRQFHCAGVPAARNDEVGRPGLWT
jgi:hypothetical protein